MIAAFNSSSGTINITWCIREEHYPSGNPQHGDMSECITTSHDILSGSYLVYSLEEPNSGEITNKITTAIGAYNVSSNIDAG